MHSSMLKGYCIISLWNLQRFLHIPAPSVLILFEGMLGSPVPKVLVATTRNSYSIHGIKSTAFAASMFPSMIGGSK